MTTTATAPRNERAAERARKAEALRLFVELYAAREARDFVSYAMAQLFDGCDTCPPAPYSELIKMERDYNAASNEAMVKLWALGFNAWREESANYAPMLKDDRSGYLVATLKGWGDVA